MRKYETRVTRTAVATAKHPVYRVSCTCSGTRFPTRGVPRRPQLSRGKKTRGRACCCTAADGICVFRCTCATTRRGGNERIPGRSVGRSVGMSRLSSSDAERCPLQVRPRNGSSRFHEKPSRSRYPRDQNPSVTWEIRETLAFSATKSIPGLELCSESIVCVYVLYILKVEHETRWRVFSGDRSGGLLYEREQRRLVQIRTRPVFEFSVENVIFHVLTKSIMNIVWK